MAPAAAAAWARRLALAVPPSCPKAGRLARRKMPPPMLVLVAPRNIRSRFRWREEFLVTRHRRPRSRSARTRTAAEAGQKLCSSTFGPRLWTQPDAAWIDESTSTATCKFCGRFMGATKALQECNHRGVIGGTQSWQSCLIDFLWLVHVINDNN